MKFAHINKNNEILGWYDDSIHSEIPTPNIKVDEEVWQEAININANCYENGNFIVKDFRTEKGIETQRVQAIKAKAGELIRNKYPDYKQLNIIRVAGVELEAMTAYIDGIRAISNEAEKSEVKVEDIQWQ